MDEAELFRMIADSTYDWETWVDARGEARWINPAVTRITGYSVDECLAMADYPLALAHPPDRSLLAQMLSVAARGHSGNDVEFRITHKNGSVHWVAVSFQSVTSPDGRALGYRTSIREIDERKQMEEELHAIRRRAEALAQARSELLANVSHELRSPAHCIAGFVELLMHEKLAPAQRRYVELISDQCSSMLRQVEDLLSLAALEAGGVELMLAPLELPALIGSLLESVEPTAQARGITLSSELALSQPWVEGDVLRLKQVLQNLVDNALKFTESGSVLVAVRDDPTDPSHVVLFEVRDTGIGMQQFEVDALLAPFRQGDSGSNRRHGGVGLGLAIVERLVTAMGGKLEIESALGRGTVVRFRVPLARATKTGTEVDPDQDQPLLGRALVVDDSAPSRELLVAMLALSGVEAIEAASAQQARALLAGRDVDVVFLDYQMPESDGAEAAAMLRRVLSLRDPSRRVPIYILTANVFAREQLREAAQSVDGVLTKPLSRAALTRLLRIVRSEPALPPSPTHTQIDRVVVDELLSVRGKDGSPLLHRLLPKVATDMAETLDALETAASELDGPAVTRHAHAAAGHAAIVGARACAHLARELEDKSREQPDDGLTLRELASLRNAWTSALGELQSVLSNALTDK